MRELPSPTDIVRVFEQHPGRTFRLRELVVALGLRSSQARELKQALKDLSKRGKIDYLKKNHFALVTHGRCDPDEARSRTSHAAESARGAGGARRHSVSGRLIGHRDGYGFVVPDQPVAGSSQDIFIPPGGMGSAMHGDRVDVEVVRARTGRRPGAGGGGGGKVEERLEGRVIRVVERAQKTVVGEFHCGPRHNYVLPYDHRIPFEIIIPRGQEWPAEEAASRHRQFGGESEGRPAGGRAGAKRSAQELEGLIVDAEITSFPGVTLGRASPPRGRVAEVLGRRADFGVDVEIVIRKFHLPHRFPAEVLAEAEAAPQYISEAERAGRRDFRALPIVTIDGETAKDFDDAVHVERLASGNFLLQVHIADVAHYVRPGTGLDREARLRGTSVYFPDRAVPMLPLELSNGICSLNPHVDRLAMSVLMELDGEGRIVNSTLAPGIIKSAERMTYTAVNAVLTGDAAALERYHAQAEHFRRMETLARILNRSREARGSIDFDLPEPEIEFDEHGRMIGVTRSERNIAHRLIEEFMLAANETVARFLEQRGVPTLYRIHEKPDPKKVLEFEEIAATFGYSLGVKLPAARRVRVHRRDERERYPRFEEVVDAGDFEITSRHYQRLTQRIAGKPEERILSFLMLRSLKQARYSDENAGHFALASPAYLHFTSPIRRYPDLIVHRILKAVLEKEGASARADAKELHLLGIETSEAERRAADAERELMDWKKASFMAGRLGDEFDALIISLTKHGFFVELVDLFVEGIVPLESLADDRYVYRDRLRAIVGERSKRAYHLGERVRVRLDRIDPVGNKLQFSVAG
ncbi:MAG TPA: VacB/RNase II family 3'-5' exoribonuclease [Terriglobia bacterium]|nr:VacB/RNase II family 3'-5' exoribonuclease [Terriglobia bacterium]